MTEDLGLVCIKLKKGDAIVLDGVARIELNNKNTTDLVRIVVKAPKTTKISREKGKK